MIGAMTQPDGSTVLELGKLLQHITPVYLEVGAQRFQLIEVPLHSAVRAIRITTEGDVADQAWSDHKEREG